jgi:N-acetylglucosaminyl-diphospho-decaprenol L-rhamnosyltransferase
VTVTLSVVIVNYNGADFIKDCLDSIFSSAVNFQYEVIIVDNGSTDDSLLALAPYESRITSIRSDTNLGFSGGNNKGIERASGTYVFLLNNDTILNKSTLQDLVSYYQRYPDTGAIGPRLLNEDGSLQRYGGVLGNRRLGTSEPIFVSFISGAAFFTTKDILIQTKGLDENYFFYNEDLDLSKVILKMGKSLVYLPTASLTHLGGQSTKFRKAASLVEGYRGGLYYCYKHYARPLYHFYRVLLLFDFVLKIGFHMALVFFQPYRKEYLRAYLSLVKINLVQDIRSPLKKGH